MEPKDRRPNFTVWLMGPTASGKTTLARALKDRLTSVNSPAIHYDGDEVRNFFGDLLGFADQDRLRVVKTITHLAGKASRAGLNVIVSALTANPDARELIRREVPNLVIIYLQCELQECALRDPKGIYQRARSGEINTLIGYNSPYLPPDDYDLSIDTEKNDLEACVEKVLNLLRRSHPCQARNH